MKDKEFQFEEIEISHTLGGAGEGGDQGRGEGSGEVVHDTPSRIKKARQGNGEKKKCHAKT